MRKLLLILVVFGCNPVKQVLKDKSKLDEVAKEVIRQGYCANDTLVIVKSDTIVKVDSLIEISSDTTIINDTAYITLFNNRNFYHGADYHPEYYKILMKSFGKVKYPELLAKQIKETKNIRRTRK
jgi:hypothetical protein